ncbi:MAG: hypothetical protein WC838_05085 [Candidatus Margulisiibacteriota bacterium]|jgi:hypothetical protein
MKKYILFIGLALILIASIFAVSSSMLSCPPENVVALRHFFATVDELSAIPDTIFTGMNAAQIPSDIEGTIPATANTPFAGDWASYKTLSNNVYEKEFVQKTLVGGQLELVLSANFTLSPAKGTIFLNKPKYCQNKANPGAPEAALANNSTMKIKYDYTDPAQKTFVVMINNMAPDLTGTGNPYDQYIAVTYNSITNEYLLSSTMVFEDANGNFVSYPELPTQLDNTYVSTFFKYNKGTVLFNAKVKSPNSRTLIYTDRATSASDKQIDLSSYNFNPPSVPLPVGTGPWPTPFYIDATMVTPDVTDPGWFDASEKSAVQNLPLFSHSEVKAGNI